MLRLPKYKLFFAIGDAIALLISFLVSFAMVGKINSLGNLNVALETLFLVLISIFYFLFFFQQNNLYKIDVILSNQKQLQFLLRSLFYGIIVMIFIAFLGKSAILLDSRKFILVFFLSSVFLLVIERFVLLRNIYLFLSKSDIFKRNTVIIGAGKNGKLIAVKLLLEKKIGIHVFGFIDDKLKKGEKVVENLYVLGKTEELEKIINEYKINEIILAIDNITYERALEILDDIKKFNVIVKVSSELFEVIPRKIYTEKYSDIDVVNLSLQVNDNLNYYIKRIIDYAGASLGIILLSPVFIVVAVLIKLTSKGPVFYKQIRIGKDGKPFEFIKFRSMTVVEGEDNERKEQMIKFMKEEKPQKPNSTKIINEKRITWIGRIIRKTSIDELPQLFNVLKGEMSLVGPRPCLPYEYENYDEWQKKRLKVLPGCTGVWQVYGRSEVSFKDSVVLDLYYINNMSPWLDLQLIFKTIPVMILAKGGE